MWIKNLAFWRKKSSNRPETFENPDPALTLETPLNWAEDYFRQFGREKVIERLKSLIDSDWKVDAFIALGNIERVSGQPDTAINWYKQALNVTDSAFLAWINLSQVYREQKNFLLAKRATSKARSINPDSPQVYAELLSLTIDTDEQTFLRYIKEIDEKAINHPTITRLRASFLSDRGEVDEALSVVDRYLHDLPDGLSSERQDLYFLKVLINSENNRLDAALESCRQLVEAFPDFGIGRLKVGVLYRNQARYDQALDEFRHAEELMRDTPEVSVPRWHMALTHFLKDKGEYPDFWQEYEYRRLCEDFKVNELPIAEWAGEAESITLYLVSEQGIGDEIMFAGFINEVAPKVDKLIVECSQKLVDIYRDSFPGAQVVSIEQGRGEQLWRQADKYIAIGSLPLALGLRQAGQLRHAGYLRAHGEYLNHYRDAYKRPGELLVGVSWRGGVPHTRTRTRSVAIDEFFTLLDIPGIRFVNLQYNTVPEERAFLASLGDRVVVDDQAIADYRRTAALVATLDVVVSVQTAIVHLAGALDVPVRALISYGPEWRYAGDDRMLWYDSVKLLRQSEEGSWRPVLEAAAQELRSLVERG